MNTCADRHARLELMGIERFRLATPHRARSAGLRIFRAFSGDHCCSAMRVVFFMQFMPVPPGEHSLFLSMPRASGSEACRRRRVSGKLILPETRMFEAIVPLGNQMPPYRLRITQHVWGLFIPDLLESTRNKYVRRRRWCEGPRCMFIRTDGLFRILSSFAYDPLSRAYSTERFSFFSPR